MIAALLTACLTISTGSRNYPGQKKIRGIAAYSVLCGSDVLQESGVTGIDQRVIGRSFDSIQVGHHLFHCAMRCDTSGRLIAVSSRAAISTRSSRESKANRHIVPKLFVGNLKLFDNRPLSFSLIPYLSNEAKSSPCGSNFSGRTQLESALLRNFEDAVPTVANWCCPSTENERYSTMQFFSGTTHFDLVRLLPCSVSAAHE